MEERRRTTNNFKAEKLHFKVTSVLVRSKGCGQEEDSWVCFEDMTESAQQEVLNRYKWGKEDADDTGVGLAVPSTSPDAIDL
mmetsp:Transcript_28610/g.69504  ORF Transcript_28610/g.69504 Transcript_28610/m.69504 type:complete len:82 (+) Transcript_28610:844-1089(+)